MGWVFLAVREVDRERVALKVMRQRLLGDEPSRRRFLREAGAAAQIRHEHLVPVLDAGEADGRPYLVMRHVDGRTVEQRIAEAGPLPIPDVSRLVAETAAALAAVHRHGLVHRDVKTSNVMLARDGAAALTDFGLAKGAGYSTVTTPGQMLGTLDYLAPELIRGEPATPSSDLYALGCVAFECISGQPPFAGRGMFALGMAHLDEAPGDPCAQRPDAPPGYGPAIVRALAKDPAARPPSPMAFARLLQAAGNPDSS